jgi:hypothetical protein
MTRRHGGLQGSECGEAERGGFFDLVFFVSLMVDLATPAAR